MIFRQLFDHDTWTYSYLLADEASREAIIIDPVVEKMPLYTQLFKELGVKLTHALDTCACGSRNRSWYFARSIWCKSCARRCVDRKRSR